MKRETAFIIHSKYVDIKFQLLSERGKYTSLLKNMESGLRILKNELAGLETMLDDAIYVSRGHPYHFTNLVLTLIPTLSSSFGMKPTKISSSLRKKPPRIENVVESRWQR